jgi:hypothetical protein
MNGMNTPLGKQVSVFFLASVFSFATVLCGSTQNGLGAQAAPSGPFSLSFTNSSALVYDLTGSYQFDQEVMLAGGGTVKVSLGLSVQQDAVGGLRGSGVTNIQVGNEVVAASYSASGKVTGGGVSATRATVSVRWLSQGTAAGATGPFTISAQYNLAVGRGGLSGTASGLAKFANLGSGTIKPAVSGVPLPAGADGTWSVKMNLQPSGSAGSIILANGRSLPASLARSSSARSELETIKLSGVGGNGGSTLNINFFPATSALDSVSGKVLGQTVTFKNPTARIPSPTVSQGSLTSSAVSQLCLECHTPIQQTLNGTRHPQVGVTCESCHPNTANHAANPYDPAAKPVLDVIGTVCGTCHTGPRQPIYGEWKASGHATAAVGCPTCHEPHKSTGFPDQLRAPLFSTNDYYSATTAILPNNTKVNLCAQCHNDHGASWTTSSAPPPPTLQYNMLLGTVGELEPGLPSFNPAYHALFITNQCVGCHMQTRPYLSSTQPAVTGHKFTVDSYGMCAGCHGSAVNASNLVVFATTVITSQIKDVKAALDLWATTKAPPSLTAKYGKRAWEYTKPGALSPGGLGPNAAGQALIPANIKKARFNLYLVLYDGSFGVHNGLYSLTLLDTAQSWVDEELSP